jgi:hypothetical protein
MAIEEPKYETLLREGDFEVRKYAPYLIAETRVQAGMDSASNQGFRRIADFIFGNNSAPQTESSQSPDAFAPPKSSTKIAMTAPVVVEPLSTVQDPIVNSNEWRIFFVMPSQYTEQSLPVPNNPNVQVRAVAQKYYAVLSYSGFNWIQRVQDQTNLLREWVQNNQLQSTGLPKLARYDPPWTLPMFRRNEILIELDQLDEVALKTAHSRAAQ